MTYLDHKSEVFIYMFLAIWITASNLCVLLLISSSSCLRKKWRNKLIISITVSGLLVGCLGCPMIVDQMLGSAATYGCQLNALAELTMYFSNTFIAAWGIFYLNVHYLLRLSRVNMQQMCPSIGKISSTISVLLPWLSMLGFVLPIFIFSSNRFHLSCAGIMSTEAQLMLISVCHFIPTLLIIITGFSILAIHCLRKTPQENDNNAQDALENPLCFLFPSMVVIIMSLPDNCIFLTVIAHVESRIYWILYYLVPLGVTMSGVLPFTWFLLPDIRDKLKEKLRCCPWFWQQEPNNENETLTMTALTA